MKPLLGVKKERERERMCESTTEDSHWHCMKSAIYQTRKTSSNIFIKYYQKNESCVRYYQIDSHPLGARVFGAP